jgi:ORF6N domain
MTRKSQAKLTGPVAAITGLILILRAQRIVLDSELASLYGVTTKRLNEQVKRNADRFPTSIATRDFRRSLSLSTVPSWQHRF